MKSEFTFAHHVDLMDDEALHRYRRHVLSNDEHDLAPINVNSLRRLIARIDVAEAKISGEVREHVARLYCAAGCDCCRDTDAFAAASAKLGELLGVPRYDDDSGVDWYSARDAAVKGGR